MIEGSIGAKLQGLAAWPTMSMGGARERSPTANPTDLEAEKKGRSRQSNSNTLIETRVLGVGM
ncbi:MAG: hypothetical protein DMF60_17340 [Acidobacteria bacterium]|nr:MAG: hypothetical protein DMF60_17340 [Acidobacteriota bacterium]